MFARARHFEYDARVRVLRWIAAAVFFLQLPIPLYWFVVHPKIEFWRKHRNGVYGIGLLFSWGLVTPLLILFRGDLIRHGEPAPAMATAGLVLIALEILIFWHVKSDLGTARLVGAPELSGGGEIVAQGIYARIRHPRYTASFLAIVGACLIAGTRLAWIAAGVWAGLTLIAIRMEEREMRARFGEAFEDYCRRVPRFLPLMARSKSVRPAA